MSGLTVVSESLPTLRYSVIDPHDVEAVRRCEADEASCHLYQTLLQGQPGNEATPVKIVK